MSGVPKSVGQRGREERGRGAVPGSLGSGSGGLHQRLMCSGVPQAFHTYFDFIYSVLPSR